MVLHGKIVFLSLIHSISLVLCIMTNIAFCFSKFVMSVEGNKTVCFCWIPN